MFFRELDVLKLIFARSLLGEKEKQFGVVNLVFKEYNKKLFVKSQWYRIMNILNR